MRASRIINSIVTRFVRLMKNKKILLLRGVCSVIIFGFFLWYLWRIDDLTKHITVKHPVIQLQQQQEVIFDLLKGKYLLSVGNKNLEEDVTFPFSISERIKTSSKEFHFDRQYPPPLKDNVTEFGYSRSAFRVEQSGKVTMLFDVSMPENARLYLHLHGIE